MAEDPQKLGSSLLTGHPTRPRSLWRDLRDALPPETADRRNLYAHHLDPDALEERDRERTLGMLEEHGLPDLLVVRFHGRSERTWSDTSRSAAERFRYLYSEDELEELAGQLREVVEQARESHLLMNNCYRDYSVRNAAQLRDLLSASAS